MAKTIEKARDSRYRKKQLSRTDESIMKIIYSIANKYHNPYCNPREKTILQTLQMRYKIKISIRNLSYRLRTLEAKGYLITRKVCGRTKEGKIYGRANYYFITRKMKRFLKGIIKQAAIWISKDNSLLKDTFNNFKSETIELYQYAHQKYINIRITQQKEHIEQSKEEKMIQEAERRLQQKRLSLGITG